jgi:hypothetical protein
MAAGIDPDAPFLLRFEQYWAAVLATFEEYRQVWAGAFDLLEVAERVPRIRAAVAKGLQDGRMAWASLLHGIDPQAEPEKAQAVGSLHQALLSSCSGSLIPAAPRPLATSPALCGPSPRPWAAAELGESRDRGEGCYCHECRDLV